MDLYLQSTACKGRRPGHLPPFRHRSRSALLTKMMRERNVVRFLVAPKAFGKTTLALEYAESIFSLEHVFWVEANDPRFLRDLDKGIIGSGLLSQSTKTSLVVFDDVPYLDSARRDALSRSFDLLLARGWEVIAIASPACAVFDSCQVDQIRIDAGALLVSDEEIDNEVSRSERAAESGCRRLLVERVPGLYWGDDNARQTFLFGIAREELPSELLLPLFSMLVLQRGSFADIAALMKGWHDDVAQMLFRNHPYLGIDMRAGTFHAASFALSALAQAFEGFLDKIALSSRSVYADALIAHLADLLLARDEAERACETMEICTVPSRVKWLALRQESLLCSGHLLCAQRLFMHLAIPLDEQQARLLAVGSWRVALLGDRAEARRQAERVAFSVEGGLTDRMLAELLLARYGDEDMREKACRLLADALRCDVSSPEIGIKRLVAARLSDVVAPLDAGSVHRYHLELLGAACLCLRSCPVRGITFVCEKITQALATRRSDALELAAVLMVMALRRIEKLRGRKAMTKEVIAACRRLAACKGALLARIAQEEKATLPLWVLTECAAVIEVEGKQSRPVFLPVSASVWGSFAESLMAQRGEYLRARGTTLSPSADVSDVAVAGVAGLFAVPKKAGIPPLYVRLFGGLALEVGGKSVDAALFRRQKVQTLCAILVLNRGKEIARVTLQESLWPDSSPEKARNNLYSIWSMLRRALSTDAGTCPYLIRLQHSCKIDASLVSSDVFELDALCNRLLFSSPDTEIFSQVYTQIDVLYTGDLLPGEAENPLIVNQRNELRTRLVDALVAAAGALYRVQEYSTALQFARKALHYDETREDVYKILIQVQLAIGQRSGAMEMYFRCRAYLTNELGIDPSAHMVALYNQMLTDEVSVNEQLSLPFS
ncbi:MAG: bacterial transcriptional activator domain-containing protein [Raoultibacter sp.]